MHPGQDKRREKNPQISMQEPNDKKNHQLDQTILEVGVTWN